MKNTFFISALLLLLSLSCNQDQDQKAAFDENPQLSDSLPAAQNNSYSVLAIPVSPYELGDSISNYEMNFKNLFNNWTTSHLENAGEYELLDYSFVESIADSSTYKRYRSYFSGDKPVYASMYKRTSRNSSGWSTQLVIRPGYLYEELRETTGLPEAVKKVLTKEFRQKALKRLSEDLSIDTMDLQYHSYSFSEKEFRETHYPLKTIGWDESTAQHNIASKDSLSQNYIDVVLTKEKRMVDLSLSEARDFFLEQLIIRRIQSQLHFNDLVRLGDRVYKIDFTHNGELFTNYVIIDAKSKKVIIDTFFQAVTFDIPSN